MFGNLHGNVRRLICAAAFAAAGAQFAAGQLVQLQFQQTVGGPGLEWTYDAVETFDQGYLTIGATLSPDGIGRDIVFARYHPDGSFFLPWGMSPIVMPLPGDDVGYSVTRVFDGGFALGIETNTFGPMFGLGLIKLSPGGFPQFPSLVFSGTAFADGTIGAATAPMMDAIDGSVLAVSRWKTGIGQDGTLVRVSNNGWFPIFARSYFDISPIEGSYLSFSDVRQTLDGRIVVCGWIAATAQSPKDGLVAWFDPMGNPMMALAYGFPHLDEYFDSIEVLGDGTYAVTGRDSGYPVATRYLRLDPFGQMISSVLFPNFISAQSCVREDRAHQRLIIAGSRPKSDVAAATLAELINCDYMGMNSYAMAYGAPARNTSEHGEAALAMSDCGYALFGDTASFNVQAQDQYFVKTSVNLLSGCNEVPVPDGLLFEPMPIRDVPLMWRELQWTRWEVPMMQSFNRNVLCFGVVCKPDFDGDGFITGIDYDLFVQAFEAGDFRADFDCDGFLTGPDFDQFVVAFEAGC